MGKNGIMLQLLLRKADFIVKSDSLSIIAPRINGPCRTTCERQNPIDYLCEHIANIILASQSLWELLGAAIELDFLFIFYACSISYGLEWFYIIL